MPTFAKAKKLNNMDRPRPEIAALLDAVGQKFGEPIRTPNDFDHLADAIAAECKKTVSSSTLKRLWGYVKDQHAVRTSSLDRLAQYVGYRTFDEFVRSLDDYTEPSSALLDVPQIRTADLVKGNTVTIGWKPNRVVWLRYDGDDHFTVLRSDNAQLHANDTFTASTFTMNQPLFVHDLVRGGETLPTYVAGLHGGLCIVTKG